MRRTSVLSLSPVMIFGGLIFCNPYTSWIGFAIESLGKLVGIAHRLQFPLHPFEFS